MAKVKVYSKTKKATSFSLPKIFGEKENMTLLAQAIRVYADRKKPRRGKVKTRGEVVASTRKIWRQKGTGRARHGALSAPIFVGGGKAHGPRGDKRELNLPKKMKKKALSIALSLKAKENQVFLIDEVSKIKKTKEAQKLIDKVIKAELKEKAPNKITICLDAKNKEAQIYFRNIKNVDTFSFDDLNAYKVFYGGILLIDKKALSPKKETKK